MAGFGTNFVYEGVDPLHRLRSRTFPDTGVEAVGYISNTFQKTSYTNELGNVWTYAYDLISRKTNEIALNVYTNSFAYGAAGDLLILTDGKGQTTTWKYDVFGRVTNKLDNLGANLFFYGYDANNRLTTRTSAAKGTTSYSYDNEGNLTLIDYPLSPDITLQYDALSRLTNMVDAVGTTHYSYDAVGQVLSEDGPWDSDTVAFTYANRLRMRLSVAAPNASAWSQTYGYDTMQRLTNVTSPAGVFGYTYVLGADFESIYFPAAQQYFSTHTIAPSLVQKLLLPNGACITNAYDVNARLLGTYLRNSSDATLDSEEYVYNFGGQRTQQVFAAGNFMNYTYDSIGELKTAVGKEPGGTTNRMQEQFGYVYDAAGNLNYRTNKTLLQKFDVNNLNELTTVTNGGKLTVAGSTTSPATNVTVNGSNSILYVDSTFAGTNQSWSFGNNTYTAVAKDSFGRGDTNVIAVDLEGTNNLAYDLNGNLLTNGTRVLEYDDENQLIRITQPNAWKSEFVYDGKMRRRMATEFTWHDGSWLPTNIIHYVYDGFLVVQERDGNDMPKVTYTRGTDLGGGFQGDGGIGGIIARSDMGMWIANSPSAHTLYHADGNGNITALIYTNQSIAAKYQYDPYGNILSQIGPMADANTYRFSSEEYHRPSGLISYLYRYYDSGFQRWLNTDPIGETGFESRIRLRKGGFPHSKYLEKYRAMENSNPHTFVMNAEPNNIDVFGLAYAWTPRSIINAPPPQASPAPSLPYTGPGLYVPPPPFVPYTGMDGVLCKVPRPPCDAAACLGAAANCALLSAVADEKCASGPKSAGCIAAAFAASKACNDSYSLCGPCLSPQVLPGPHYYDTLGRWPPASWYYPGN